MSEEEATTEKAVQFTLEPVEEKPSRRYRKGSKYDPVLEAFVAGNNDMVTVSIPEKDANYIRTQLNKRITALSVKHPRKYRNIVVSVVNDLCYLEKATSK